MLYIIRNSLESIEDKTESMASDTHVNIKGAKEEEDETQQNGLQIYATMGRNFTE